MAVRGCLTLLFILLSGIVHADMTSPLPSTAELKTSKLSSVPSSTSVYSSTIAHSTTASMTTTETTSTTSSPTTTKSTTETKVTTSTPTTTESTTETKVTTSAPSTTHQSTTNSTTEMTVTTFTPTTTHHNTTNFTTEVPTTAHTNATTVPTTPVPNPTVGNYSIKSGNASICLLAKMGLQFSFKISGNASLQTVDLDPDVTTVSGTCGSGGSDSSLLLTSKEITVQFIFTNVSQKFHLHALTLNVNLGNGISFNESNTNLSLWEASVGSSYLCKKEQSYNISDKLTLNTFELQVQPFDVKKNVFSTAHECSMDDTSLLIPIIVGAALAGLIFIVVIAYVIGRRRTYVGYQTL